MSTDMTTVWSHMSHAPHYYHAVDGLSSRYFCLPTPEYESYVNTGLLAPAYVSETYLLGQHQQSPQPPGLVGGGCRTRVSPMYVSAPLLTATPITEGGLSVDAASAWNARDYAHPAWKPQLQAQQLLFSNAEVPDYASSAHPLQHPLILESDLHALAYSCAESYASPVDAELPSAVFSINNSSQNAPISQVNGTSSVLGGIPALLVPPSVAVFAGGTQEVFWRRACLRVTCVPVASSSGRHGEVTAAASGDAQRAVRLEEIRDMACSSSCRNSHKGSDASGEGLDDLVWHWLDTLGMADAVEDVLSPGAGRVLVMWKADFTYAQDIREGDASDDGWRLSTAGGRLARLLGVRGDGEGSNSDLRGALCEVIVDGMRLLLD
nr:unnamed protein product [Leishmania braziliensis]